MSRLTALPPPTLASAPEIACTLERAGRPGRRRPGCRRCWSASPRGRRSRPDHGSVTAVTPGVPLRADWSRPAASARPMTWTVAGTGQGGPAPLPVDRLGGGAEGVLGLEAVGLQLGHPERQASQRHRGHDPDDPRPAATRWPMRPPGHARSAQRNPRWAAGPEHPAAEDDQQRRQQGDHGAQPHGDAHRHHRAEALVELARPPAAPAGSGSPWRRWR